MPGLTHNYWTYPRALVEDDEAPQLQLPVSRPGWASVGHPVPEFPNNLPETHACHPESQQPVLKADRIHPLAPTAPDSCLTTVSNAASVMSTVTISGGLPL